VLQENNLTRSLTRWRISFSENAGQTERTPPHPPVEVENDAADAS